MGIAYNSSIVTNGLVLCVDAANRKTYPGSGSILYDISGNNNNFTLVNTPLVANNRIQFNGTNQYAYTTSALNLSGLSAITVEMWIYMANGNTAMAIEHTANWNTNTGGWGMAINDSGNGGNIDNYCHTNHNTSIARNYAYTRSTWNQHVNIYSTVSDATGRITYLNGALISFNSINGYATGTSTAGGSSLPNATLYLGSRGGASAFLNGSISMLRIYNRKLSADEILQNFIATNSRYRTETTYVVIATTVPGAPTVGTPARVSGSSTQIDVPFTAPASDGGAPITSYTAVSSPGNITGSISQSGSGTIRVSGLTAGTSYTFTVYATNTNGNSANSSASSSVIPASVPGAPTIGSPARVSGSGTSIDVPFTAPASDGGSAITSYTAVSTPGSLTGTLSQSGSGTIRVTGLTQGTSYTFAVYATNGVGNSSNSAASSAITPAVVPNAPTIGTATATGPTSATVSFTAPASNGGSVITSYTAVSSPGGITGTLSQAGSGTITVTGLTLGQSYTFTVYATNAVGNSSSSAASNSITTTNNQLTSSASNVTVNSGSKTATATYLGSGQVLSVTGSPTVTINAWGGGGGGGGPASGGGAAGGTFTFTPTNGDTITLYIGQGGGGASTGGGGGGGTFIYRNSTLIMALGGGGGGATAGSDPGKGASASTSGVSGTNQSNGGTGGNGGGGAIDAGGGAGILSNGGAGGHTSAVAQRNNPFGNGGTGSGATGGKGGGGNGSAGGDGGGGGGGGGYSGGGAGGSGFNASGGGGGGSYIDTGTGSGTLSAGSGRTPGGTALTGYNSSGGYGGTASATGSDGYVYISWV